jgi:hypothetical protein
MTTLGSNIYPTTTGAEIISVVMLLVGISFIALLTGAIAQRFLGPEIAEVESELEEGEDSPQVIAQRQMHEVRDQLQGLEVALEQLIADANAREAKVSSP